MPAQLLAMLLAHGPELLGDTLTVFNALAHGPGGLEKIGAVLRSIEQLGGHASAALQDAQAARAGTGDGSGDADAAA